MVDCYNLIWVKTTEIPGVQENVSYHICIRHSLTLYGLMEFSFWFETMNLEWSIIYIERSQVIISNKQTV